MRKEDRRTPSLGLRYRVLSRQGREAGTERSASPDDGRGSDLIEAARAEFDVRGAYAETEGGQDTEGPKPASIPEADART
jgi:hypothetical protein